ncbi:methyltransferase domain-containing protein [Pseudomonas sp. RIT-PI-AD]|uniref:class I SAM-dependent methyltransferase n=1 Tax=Pseudomonas sp. RIT-PI-AD TaxID=3035294 RepID=UPI0021DB0342|nr:methyltransferase domain-containing protein [Pseudomonas sp. RIT-PI-AD]
MNAPALREARHRACPLCAARQVTGLRAMRLVQPSGSPLPGEYDLVACDVCDFVYADTAATQGDYDRYYAHCAKYAAANASGSGEAASDNRRLADAAERVARLLPRADSPWLDLGCGRGGLLAAVARRGFDGGRGLDPDPGCAALGARQGLKIHAGTLDRVAQLFTGQRFELIVLSHVAEHLRDLSLLQPLREQLTASGRLYIEVPDAGRYGEHPRTPFYYVDSEHINHFGPASLQVLARELGFAALALERFVLPLDDRSGYPALALIAGQGSGVPPAAPEVVSHMRAYLEACERQAAVRIEPPLPEGREVLVWGAGSMAQRLLGLGAFEGLALAAFLDNDPNKQGRQLAGRPILTPAAGLAAHADAPLLICAAVEHRQIEAECRAFGEGRTRSIHRVI